MALNTRLAVAGRNDALDAITALLGGTAELAIYDGAQPTDPDTALGGQTELAVLAMSATPFGAATGGTATANAISDDTSAVAGTAAWGTLRTGGGTRIVDFEVGTSGANLNLNAVVFGAGANVAVSAFTLSLPMQGA